MFIEEKNVKPVVHVAQAAAYKIVFFALHIQKAP